LGDDKLFDSEPATLADSEHIGQINECDLKTNAGRLMVTGCTEYYAGSLRIDLATGIYRARIYYGNQNN